MMITARRNRSRQTRDRLEPTHWRGVHGPTEKSLVRRVQLAFYKAEHSGVRAVDVSVRWSVVVLQGRVSSHYVKWLAEAMARQVPGVWELCNEIVVTSPPGKSFATGVNDLLREGKTHD